MTGLKRISAPSVLMILILASLFSAAVVRAQTQPSVSTDKSVYNIGGTVVIQVSPTPAYGASYRLVIYRPDGSQQRIDLAPGPDMGNITGPPAVVMLADLTFQKVGFDKPEPFKEGDTVYFGADIVNQGDGDASNFQVEVYLDDNSIPYDSVTISLLGANQSDTVWSHVPWTATEGIHTLTWRADATNVVAESNKRNNVMSRRFSVGAPLFDFEISVSPSSMSVKQGESATFTVTVTALTSSPQNVSLSLTGYHSTMSYNFNPNSGTPTFSSSLTVSTSGSTPPQTYNITITGRDGGRTHSSSVTITVESFSCPNLCVVKTQSATVTETTTITSTTERTSTACLLPVPATQCSAVTTVIVVVLVLLVSVLLVEVRRPPRKPSTPPPPPPLLPPATPPVTPPPTTRTPRPIGGQMVKKRIIVHFMNEEERLAALEKMTQVDQTESFLVGEIDESDIAELQRQGLVVQTSEASEDWAKAETPGGQSEPLPGVKRAEMRVGPPRAAPLLVDLTKPNFYLVGLRGPLLEDWRKNLEELGVRLLEYMPRNNYTAKLTPKQVNDVTALSFVSGVRLYGPEDTGPVALIRAETPVPPGGPAMMTYDVRLHQEEDLNGVLQWLKTHEVSVAGAKGRKIRLYMLGDSSLADELAALPEVSSMEEYVPPKLLNDVARMLLGIDRQSGASRVANLPQTGEGQIVAVADTGLDDKHPDFKGRIVGIVALGRSNDYSDPHGHGTHVTGSVLGDGAASGGVIRGSAPRAKLFFQSLLSADGGLGGLPLSLGDLFEEAYQAGARIHNNSWGSATRSMYTINSVEVDEFVAKRRDMLIIIAAGNEGQAANCLHSQPGYVDWLSIGSPGSCKNALSVGASRSSRTSGGFATLTYGQAWPQGFPNPPVASETVSGNPEGLAAFSSRGPCDDRRIKPDIVAPGTDIASAKSSRAPLRNFWGPYPENAMYAFMGGTSMAAPLVAGCAALVREYYVSNRNHEPSAALLKATLINSTKWLTGADAVPDHENCAPNYHQGFGCIWMPWAIPNPSSPNLKLEFLDTWRDPQRHLVRTGQRFRFQFSISGGNWLRICLTYTDLAARALQNNLDLFVQHMQSGQKWIGNADLPSSLKIPDPDNNVEVVRLENPQAGDYLVQITATNLLQAGQDFALVVTGELTSTLVQV